MRIVGTSIIKKVVRVILMAKRFDLEVVMPLVKQPIIIRNASWNTRRQLLNLGGTINVLFTYRGNRQVKKTEVTQ